MRLTFRLVVFTFVALLLLLLSLSCSFTENKKPSVLIIAVDGLGFSNVDCQFANSDGVGKAKAYEVFCNESVRFTHAYTTSTMAQASLTSILLGEWPRKTGVRHNGDNFLKAKFKTIAEVAIDKGYRTSFFSGGPPIFRKSGLSQGFEVFDDVYNLKSKSFYRNSLVVVNKFSTWQSKINSQPFLSVLYFSDLQFPNASTKSNTGAERKKSVKGQIAEVGESLEELIKQLRKNKSWDSSYIFLVGLSSTPMGQKEFLANNLKSERVKVALFIKPAQRKRDLGISWKVDRNVSVADLGETIFDILGFKNKLLLNKKKEVVSLLSVLNKPSVNWAHNRNLIVESAWPSWKKLSNIRYSMRRGDYLVLWDEPPSVFNTLLSRRESIALQEGPVSSELMGKSSKIFIKKKIKKWMGLPSFEIRKQNIAQKIWLNGDRTSSLINLFKLSEENKADVELVSWKAQYALDTENWEFLGKIGDQSNNEIYQFVAQKNLRKFAKIPTSNCGKLFAVKNLPMSDLKKCKSQLIIQAYNWANNPSKKNSRLFSKMYYYAKLDQELVRLSYQNSFVWDINSDKFARPIMAEAFIKLPVNLKLNIELKRHMKSLEANFTYPKGTSRTF